MQILNNNDTKKKYTQEEAKLVLEFLVALAEKKVEKKLNKIENANTTFSNIL